MKWIARVAPAVALVALTASCSQKEFKGEIVGVHTRASVAGLSDGSVQELAYDGKLAIVLPDGQKIDVACPESLLSTVRGLPQFSATPPHGGIIAVVVIEVKEKQQVVLVRNKSNQWMLSKIL